MNFLNTSIGPFLFGLIAFLLKPTGIFEADITAGLAIWMAWWWMSEAVHLMVTAFLPIIFFPLFGVADSKIIAAQYMDPIMFLFIGGFIIGFAIEKSGLHKRMAFGIINKIGIKPSGLLAAVMISAFLISNWISNTATTMLLVPAVLAIVGHLGFSKDDESTLPSALLLGLAYSSTIGGMATLVGTPPNMVFLGFYNEYVPVHNDMDFFRWSQVALPISISLLLICFGLLWLLFIRNRSFKQLEMEPTINVQLPKVWSNSELWVFFIFATTALLWLSRSGITTSQFNFTGWASFFKKDAVQDSTVAMIAALLLMVVPIYKSNHDNTESSWKPVLEFSDVKGIPFEIIMLFGSGFALAKAFELSGLNVWVANQLVFFSNFPLIAIIFGVCLLATIISEFASNVACIQLLLPILMPFSAAIDVSPLTLMVPATLASSLGFMLPVATAPNNIVFGTGYLSTKQFLKAGFWLDISGILVITLVSWIVFC